MATPEMADGRIRLTEPIRTGVANGGYSARGRVPAAKAERPLSVQSRDLRGDAGQRPRRAGFQPFAGPLSNRGSVTERSQAIEDRLPVLVAGEIVVGDEELANAGLSAIPGESDIHPPILRLSLGRVVRCNGVGVAEALSR